MKKTYINPELMIVRLKTMGMIALSNKINNRDATKDSNGDYNDSRRSSGFWDDDDY